MLKGINPVISPDLLCTLHRMGHGDEIVFADAHFPGESLNKNIIRSDGIKITALIEAILPLFELDTYVDKPVIMMSAVKGDVLDEKVEKSYMEIIQKTNPEIKQVARIERFAFYERAKKAFVVVMTGETAKYGNIILKKGVTPV